MKLMREIRFSALPAQSRRDNSWAGWPAATTVAPFLTLRVVVQGPPDPRTGYLCNIQDLDRLVRERAVPVIVQHCRDNTHPSPGEVLLEESWRALSGTLPPKADLHCCRLSVTPYLSYTITAGAPDMIAVTESFEFSASHRLYCPEFSEEKNRAVFGKCANPNGHGHNYLLEVTLRGRPDADSGVLIAIGALERIVKERIIDRFDHKHLNQDCAEFCDLNPSVENITQVIWNLLEGQFPAPAGLARVRVWETPKTYAEIGID